MSESVSERRAAIEMGASLRHARSLLQEDLANHTCPALTWTRPESNHGYIEIVEGPQCDFDPSIWLRDEVDNDSPANRTPDGLPDPIGPANLTLDLAVSQLPSSNLFRLPGGSIDVRNGGAVTDVKARVSRGRAPQQAFEIKATAPVARTGIVHQFGRLGGQLDRLV